MNLKSSLGLILGVLTLVGCSSLNQTPQTSSTPLSLASTVGGNSSLLLVNGQPLDVSTASVTVDDDTTGSAKDVKPGMEISGDGSSDGKGKVKMSHVDVRWRMKGTIDAIDTTNSTLQVVGLSATVDAATLIFKENSDGTETALVFGDLKQGDYVKLAGIPQTADDSVLATRIEVYSPSDTTKTDFRVMARTLDSSTKKFTYGLKTITVDYNSATVVGTPASDVLVRVKGSRAGDTVTASLVKAPGSNSPNPISNGQQIELRGAVSSLNTTDKTFVVQGYTVTYTTAAVKGTLADKAIVEVHGKVTSDKTADALQVRVEDASEHGKPDGKKGGTPSAPAGKLEGSVSDFDATTKTLKIRSIAVSVSSSTKYEIKNAEVTADVFWGTDRNGAKAEAVGKVSSSGVVADKLEIE